MADDLGERTEEATPKRRQEAREEGNVSKSQDFAAALLLTAVTVAWWMAAMPSLGQGKLILEALLDGSLSAGLDIQSVYEISAVVGSAAVRIAMPILLVLWIAGYLATFLQVGWLFTTKSIQPKLSKLNPLKGFQRIFGISGLVKAALDSLKVLVVVLVATLTVYQHGEELVLLPYLSLMQALSEIGWFMFDLALRVLAVLLILGVLDLIYQKWKHAKDLRMTKQQVKDELKQTEGDPEVKRRRYRIQQQLAMQRLNAAVPNADVIVTNPEHISVAIQYDGENMNAPRVVAKGADYIALRIRQIAVRHGIPIVERKPLARALYRDVEVGQEVPPQFYQAVAEILAYVYRLSGRKAG